MAHAEHSIRAGDLISLTQDIPHQWENTGNETADGTIYEKKVAYLSLRVGKGGLVSNRGTV